MIRYLFVLTLIFQTTICTSQTYSWSGYTAGSTSYTTGIMTATITSSSPGFQNSSPKYYSGATVGSGQCGIAGGLALEQMFGNITSAHVTVTINFTSGNTTNGTCASMQFQIKDINADESFQTFRDMVQISAIDGTNTAIPAANITVTGGTNKAISNSGNSKIIYGSTGSYGSRSQTTCDNVTVTVTPPSGATLKSITIRYQPSYETCANCYYNFTGPNRPAYQYISIGALTATPTSGCVVLPAELRSFEGKCINDNFDFNWETFTETNNDYFQLEGSNDAENFTPLQKINGTGNSNRIQNYQAEITEAGYSYFRLKQVDLNGEYYYSETIQVLCKNNYDVLLFPNPADEQVQIQFNETVVDLNWKIYDIAGKLILENSIQEETQNLDIPVTELAKGMYHFILTDNEGYYKELKFIKE